MKISETCKCLGITRYTLYKMIEAGLLVHDYIDSYYMCDQEELDKSLDKHVRAIWASRCRLLPDFNQYDKKFKNLTDLFRFSEPEIRNVR